MTIPNGLKKVGRQALHTIVKKAAMVSNIGIVGLAILMAAPSIHAQNITTVAGNGTLGYNGEGMAATKTALNFPKGMAFDSFGNMYFADNGNNRIRRITTSGTVSTVAGTGVAGFSGDGGLATSAMLNQPGAVAFDTSGNMFIADSQNRRVRKVNSSGIITTIAGTGVEGDTGDNGPGTSAQLHRAVDLAVDGSGNVYFADSVGNKIRRIATDGTISTVAGTGVAGFSGDFGVATTATLNTPDGIAIDSTGNLYIADARNHRIRKVRPSDSVIFTVAGNGVGAGTDTGSFSGDNGLATQAGLNTPEGVAVNAAGDVYIADLENYRIRKLNVTTNIITTVAGTGTDGFSGDSGPAVQALLNLPWTIATDASGNIYIGDLQNNRIREVTFISASSGSPTYYFAHLAFGGVWQTTLTFNNYSTQAVTCQTSFFAENGGALLVSFPSGSASSRSDTLPPGGTVHTETNAAATGSTVVGWAKAQCTGAVKASVLFRSRQNGVAIAEAGVNAMTAPATKFVTFAEVSTGFAVANPSATAAQVTFKAFNTSGQLVATTGFTLQPGAHTSANFAPLFGLNSFTGSVQITSTVPVISLSLNAEASPSISSLPPGELNSSVLLATGSGSSSVTLGFTNTYDFAHLALAAGWQSSLTYINYSPQAVACQTSFFADSGAPLAVPFPDRGTVTTRTDVLPGGGSLHVQTTADVNAAVIGGWAQGQCTGPVTASMLFRLYQQGAARSEAAVNAMPWPALKFVTFAETSTGVAYANPSTTQACVITLTLLSQTGVRLASQTVTLQAGQHGAANLNNLLGLSSFSGLIELTSTVPFISLSINAELAPSVSSLPPGELDDNTALAAGQ